MTILIYGDEHDTSLVEVLLKTLPKYGGVQFFSKNSLICNSLTNSKPKFLVYELDKLPTSIECSGLFIFKKSFKKLTPDLFPNNFLPIVDENNSNAINFLKKTNKIVITCGTSAKNTISFSSFSHTDAIVVLQRYLQTKNKTIEPHEFSLKLLSKREPSILLTICTILLLSDVPSAHGYEI